MLIDPIKNFFQGGMDTDSAFEYVSLQDWIIAYNVRVGGTTGSEEGYVTNPESNSLIAGTRAVGINKGIGGKAFEDIRQIVMFIYNSAGFHQLAIYDADTQTQKTIYTDKTDSGGIQLLTLDPQFYVNCILINETYLVWADGTSEVGYVNLNTLSSGGYGVVLAEDLSLIKPQCLIPITAVYASDSGKASNFVKGKLFQFTPQWENADFNYSTWGTWSKRIIPLQESTPTEGTDVTQNNCIIVSVNIGSIRVTQMNIACRYGLFDFNIIRTIDRTAITSLTSTTVDISNQIFESYDPTTNLYSFVFYNESLNIPVPPTETDQFVDYIWVANAIEKINGNNIALGGLKVGYPRPTTDVTLSATGYDPNLNIPSDSEANPLKVVVLYAGGEGSGSNKPKRRMQVNYTGIPHTGDVLAITTNSASDAGDTTSYSYTVPSGQNGNLAAVVLSFSGILSGAVTAQSGGYTITFYEDPRPHRRIQIAIVTLFNAGATISKSIHAFLDNSSYQFALSYRDKYGRPFPLLTNSDFIVNTPSFAQLQGNTPRVNWTVPIAAPVGAYDFQWLVTKNTTAISILDVMGNLLNYKGTWNSKDNVPALAAGTGTVGDTYQITTPNNQSTNHVNLGNGEQNFKSGDYVSYNGKSYDIIEKSFADLTDTSNVLAIKINPLNLFNQHYTNNNIDTVLKYDFTQGDKCTFHYYINPVTPGLKFYLNNPCVDVEVFGYDPTTFLVKVQKPSAINPATLIGKDLFLRLYTPNTQITTTVAETDITTIWYEIGERFTITNGNHDTLNGVITDGDVYFKTRSYNGAVDPNEVYNILATDFNFSDFYQSNFTSYGRPRSYYDILEKTEQKASIIYSENYILGSRKNGLNRFFRENIYGDSDGQTSSSFGEIQVMWQRNDYLVIGQETHFGYIPVNVTVYEDQTGQKQVAVSEKLLNNIRYNETGNIGIGTAKESFCFKDNNGYFIDPNRSEPMRIGLDGITSISGKMSKYFKATIQLAYAQKKKLVMYYNMFYDEVMLCIQTDGGVLTLFPFNNTTWSPFENYTIVPGDITGLTPGAHATVVNNGDGTATFTPTTNYVGNNVGTVTFNTTGGVVTKNICLNWTIGSDIIDPFSFEPLFGRLLNATLDSNGALIQGNTNPVSASVVGGQYSVNGGAFTTSPSFVNAGDVIVVRLVTSNSELTATSATLTVSTFSATFTATTGSTAVSPFSFTPVTNANLTTNYISNTIINSSNTIPAPISIVNGTYSLNANPFTSSPGTINSGDTVSIQRLSSGSSSTTVGTTLTIDGQSGTFNITTGTTTVSAFGFTAITEAQPSTLYPSNTISPTGNTIGVPISISLGEYSLNGGAFTSSSGTFNPGDNVTVRQTSSATVPTTLTTTSLNIGGTVGTFDVTTYHTVTVTLHNTESSSPYSDGNIQAKNNGLIVDTLNSSGTIGPLTLQSRLPMSAEAFSELPSTGTSPQKTLDVKYGGVSVGGYPITNSNNPGDPSLTWSGTGIDGGVYDYYVNAFTGGTLPSDATGIVQIDILGPSSLELCAYVATLGLAPSQQPVYQGVYFNPNPSTPPEACYALASDMRPSNDPKFRFQFNLAALLVQYPAVASFQFIVRGRDVTTGLVNGSYSLKGADAGKMVMLNSPGTYLPATSGATTIGNVGFTGRPVTNGADGTYGVAVGNVVLTLTYNVAAKTMTLT